jgi:beta-1,4-mannosyl-glycoprotein beta-1,4-N-acetylglucosaminyltransferase
VEIYKRLKERFFYLTNKRKIKIYDCFLFFNENDLLEIRLNELSNIVDYFVIVESKYTFTKKDKPFNLDLKRFEKFKDKIIYIQHQDFIRSPNPWDMEKHQRNKLIDGLNSYNKASNEDLIILSDLDEIPKASKIIEAFYLIYKNNQKYIKFNLKNYYYALNNKMTEPNNLLGPACTKRKNINTMQDLRKNNEYTLIQDSGWHYSFVQSLENIINKMQAYSHQEVNKYPNNELKFIKERIETGHGHFVNSGEIFKIVKLNSNNCPKYVLKNKKKYDKLIFKHEEPTIWSKIVSLYYNEICKLQKYTLGLRNKSSEKINKFRTKLRILVQSKKETS